MRRGASSPAAWHGPPGPGQGTELERGVAVLVGEVEEPAAGIEAEQGAVLAAVLGGTLAVGHGRGRGAAVTK